VCLFFCFRCIAGDETALGWIAALWEHCCALQAFSVLRIGVDGVVVCLDGGQGGVWVMVGLSGMVWDSWYMVDKSHLVDEDNKYEVTYFTSERANPSERANIAKCSPPSAYTTMPPQRNIQPSYTEGTLQLAIQATIEDRDESKRRVIAAFSVPRTTVQQQRQGALSQRDRKPNSKKLTKLEEEALVQRILNLNQQGIGATRAIVQDIANNLLAKRGGEPVSKH
jgi:hypothetical protein